MPISLSFQPIYNVLTRLWLWLHDRADPNRWWVPWFARGSTLEHYLVLPTTREFSTSSASSKRWLLLRRPPVGKCRAIYFPLVDRLNERRFLPVMSTVFAIESMYFAVLIEDEKFGLLMEDSRGVRYGPFLALDRDGLAVSGLTKREIRARAADLFCVGRVTFI